MTDSQGESQIREASIFDYVGVTLRHWKLVLLVCVPIVAATVVWSLQMTETFQATTSVVPPLDSTQASSSLAQGLLGGAEGALLRNVLDVRNMADVYVGILQSQVVVEAIIDRFALAQIYGQSQERSRVADQLRGNTDIKVGKEGILRISVVDRDPNRAAALANDYVEELDKQNKRLSTGQATNKRIFLENRLKEIEQKFTRIDRLPTKQAEVQEALYQLLTRECEMAKIEEAKNMPTIQVLDKAVPPDHKYKPNRTQMVLKAIVGSFALAVLLAFLREYLAQAHRSRKKSTARPQGGDEVQTLASAVEAGN